MTPNENSRTPDQNLSIREPSSGVGVGCTWARLSLRTAHVPERTGPDEGPQSLKENLSENRIISKIAAFRHHAGREPPTRVYISLFGRMSEKAHPSPVSSGLGKGQHVHGGPGSLPAPRSAPCPSGGRTGPPRVRCIVHFASSLMGDRASGFRARCRGFLAPHAPFPEASLAAVGSIPGGV